MQDILKAKIQESINVKTTIMSNSSLLNKIESIIDICTKAFKADKKVFFCGNGGSAADAQHLAAEFSGRFYFDRDPLFSEALHVNSSYITAVANDYSYEEIYARLVKAKCRKGDILFGLSTSGNSTNIIKAFEQATKNECITIALTGESGGKMKNYCDHLINVPSSDTPRIQESHILVGHLICEFVEKKLFKNNSEV